MRTKTEKSCDNCKYCSSSLRDYPCVECSLDDCKFEPSEKAIAEVLAKHRNDGEKVNHPQHYNQGKHECIDVMVENFGEEAVQHFCLLNAFKYVWRAEHKNGLEDIKKAWWYLDKYLELGQG